MSLVLFLLRRVATLVVVTLVASFLVFSLMDLAPGTPLTFLLGNRSATPQQVAAIKAEYHLDDPFLTRYWSWLVDVLHGNLGRSIAYHQSVTEVVGSRVTTGKVVCIIEAMKIMNEIESEVQGVVREVCVENAQPVEFGQVLFRLDPNG